MDQPHVSSRFSMGNRRKRREIPGFMSIHTKCFLAFVFFFSLNLAVFTLSVMQWIGALWAPVFTLLSLPAAYAAMRKLTSPARTMQSKMVDILSQFSIPWTPPRTSDEVESLAWGLSQLEERIRQLVREAHDFQALIHTINQEIESKIEKRTLALEEKNMRLRMISEELGRSFARIDDEMKVLGRMQKSLLPDPAIDAQGLSMRSFYMPSGRAGGDYYDIVQGSQNDTLLLIADVSGHGSPAAFIMGIARSMIHSEAQQHRSPSAILETLNRVLIKTLHNGEFVTMFLGRLDHDTMRFTYSNAGHPPPLFCRTGETQFRELKESRGLPLGVMENPAYGESHLDLAPGDRMILYTDGLIETHNDQQVPYGAQRLRELVESQRFLNNEDLLDTVVLELEMYVNHPLDIEPLEDDATLMILDFLASSIPNRVTAPAPQAHA